MRLTRIEVPVEVTTKVIQAKALMARVYSESGKVIGSEGEFEANMPKGKLLARVEVIHRTDGTSEMRIVLPTPLPAGYDTGSVRVYGRKVK
jgi:hypothetical protein